MEDLSRLGEAKVENAGKGLLSSKKPWVINGCGNAPGKQPMSVQEAATVITKPVEYFITASACGILLS